MAQSSVLLFLVIVIGGLVHSVQTERICDSITIGPNNCSEFAKLSKCDVIIGSLTIAKIFIQNKTEILSPLKEITGYLLVYRVEGITSLSEILPNLVIIRGNELIFDQYSFVVFENMFLKNLGLYSLQSIRNGSLKIQKNPVLCYIQTIHWTNIITDHKLQDFQTNNNMNPDLCPVCKEDPHATVDHQYICWDYNHFQKLRDEKHNCLEAKKGEKRVCSVCLHYKDSNGLCRDSCSPFIKNVCDTPGGRECFTRAECSKREGYFLNGANCERGIQTFTDFCSGDIILSTVEDVRELKYCSKINGSIIIELKETHRNIITDLEENLGEVTEISGYLQIKNSPQLTSLHFFKNLNTIGGEELLPGGVSFYVVNNHYLEELWLSNRKVQIQKGKLNFHLNPKLCVEKILDLSSQIKSGRSIDVDDVSRHSNGEETVCSNEPQVLTVEIENYSSSEVRVKLSSLKSEKKQVHLGYIYYYKETDKNVTMFQGRHGCMKDDWMIDKSLGKNVRHVIKGLKPFTRYALFVKTFAITDYHIESNSFSKVVYFRTLEGTPGHVQEFYYNVKNTSAIELHWWPPKRLNGVIDRYEIFWEEVNKDIDDDDELILTNVTCDPKYDCSIVTKERVDLNDDSYFSRVVFLFDDILPNYVFQQSKNLYEPMEGLNKSQQCKSIISNETKDMEKCEQFSKAKKPTNQGEKFQKLISSLLKPEEGSLFSEEEDQDLGITGFEIKDGIKDDFNKTTTANEKNRDNPNSIVSDVEKTKAVIHSDPKDSKENSVKVPGNVHTLLIGGLESEEHYLVSIRACVKENISKTPCGPPLIMHASPINISTAKFFAKYNISLV
ncbi:INSR family protein [Megaselia abdita]